MKWTKDMTGEEEAPENRNRNMDTAEERAIRSRITVKERDIRAVEGQTIRSGGHTADRNGNIIQDIRNPHDRNGSIIQGTRSRRERNGSTTQDTLNLRGRNGSTIQGIRSLADRNGNTIQDTRNPAGEGRQRHAHTVGNARRGSRMDSPPLWTGAENAAKSGE